MVFGATKPALAVALLPEHELADAPLEVGHQQLLALAVEREDQLTATPGDADPFND